MPTLHALLPEAVSDPTRPSGGNTYDARLLTGLEGLGWSVEEHLVAGRWPVPDATGRRSLGEAAARLPTGGRVLVDGLLASGSPEVLVPLARRTALVVLVHLPVGGSGELAGLLAASAVITTSAWSRDRLLELHGPDGLEGARLHVVEPGVDLAPPAAGTPAGGRLVCVGAVTPFKGQDVLMDALGTLTDLPWCCLCAGSLEIDAPFAVEVVRRARAADIADRVSFTGPLRGDELAHAYACADLLVQPSRVETYGMVVTEALARGVPVAASSAGGLPSTLRGPGGERPGGDGAVEGTAGATDLPGFLVAAGDPTALAAGLRSWLTDADLRDRLRQYAAARRLRLLPWSGTARHVAALLAALPD
ncbi:glycosyltransferase family 4 protein [Terrabacter sp. BE26]|uniref:glycosyltransferase family 4 protein n=1 Tax=Terrabacter sp. BE26 TaxID=2898152 RepID=UPI0035BE6589